MFSPVPSTLPSRATQPARAKLEGVSLETEVQARGGEFHSVEMGLQFICHTKGSTLLGTGCATHLNPFKVMFDADRELPCGGEIELRIMWPFLLQGVCPLELFVTGRVASSDPGQTLVHIDRYEFRTRGEHSFEPGIVKGSTYDVIA